MWTVAPSVAQQTVPQSVEPGQIQKRFAAPEAPKGEFRPDVPIIEERLPTEEARKVRLVLTGVLVVGSTVYEPDSLRPLYEDLIASEVSLADMYAIADKITERYKQDGYLLVEAVVPPQRAEFGIVRIEVIESHVERVEIRGEVEGDVDLLQRLGEKIAAVRPLRRDRLERYILLINDLPGVTAEPALTPIAGSPGAFAMTLHISHDGVEGAVVADNRGSRPVGPYQFLGVAGLNSALGNYETMRLRVATTSQSNELRYGNLEYDHPIGAEGTRAGLSAIYNTSEAGGSLRNRDIDALGVRFALTASHPVIRARHEFLQLSGRIEINRSVTEENDKVLSKDRTRVIRFGANYAISGTQSAVSTRVGGQVSQGFDIFNATESGSQNLTRADGRSDFTKLTAEASHQRGLGGGWSVLAAASGQVAASSLLSSEQFGVGGGVFGRAYDPSEITGDHGIAAKAEIQYTVPLEDDLIENAQLYVYFDRGDVWERAPTTAADRHQSLAAAGGGVRYRLPHSITGYFEVAKPLTRPVAERGAADGNDLRFFFRLAAGL